MILATWRIPSKASIRCCPKNNLYTTREAARLPLPRNGAERKNRMRSLRSLFGEPLDGAYRQPTVAVAVVRAVEARIEVKVPRVIVTRVRDGRPVAAV